jgi:hypothetical protein
VVWTNPKPYDVAFGQDEARKLILFLLWKLGGFLKSLLQKLGHRFCSSANTTDAA